MHSQSMTTIVRVPESSAGPELLLGQWADEHVNALVEIYRDPDIQRWTRVPVRDRDSAVAWVAAQQRGWANGDRLCFAVHQRDRLVGCAVLKRPRTAPEVGYWTVPSARGQGVATRSVSAVSEWAIATYGVQRLELRHQVDNVASCRVAEKAGYVFHSTLPAEPPFPLDGHVHVRTV